MLKLLSTPLEIRWPCIAVIPDANGHRQEFPFELTYRVPVDFRETTEEGQKSKALKDLIVNWKDVGDAEGNPAAFNAENLDAFLSNPFCRLAAERGLTQIYAGEFQRKN